MASLAPIQDIEKILVIRNDGIGDILNSTPAISSLRRTYRDAFISMVAAPPAAELLLLNPNIDEIIVYDPGDAHKNLIAKAQFFKKLRSEQYDLAIVLQNSSRCNFIAYASGARYRIGRKSEPKRFSSTLTDGVTESDPKGTKHEVDRNMDILRLIGVESVANKPEIYLSTEERAWARNFLRNEDVWARVAFPLIGIHPGGSSYDKLWLPENFAHVANSMVQDFDANVILFGGPGEYNMVNRIYDSMQKLPIVATGIRIRQLASLLEKCSLFICNDSGPMHIAAALRVNTVALFGPTDYVRWRPRNENAVVVKIDMDCSPCSAHKCKRNFICMKQLPVSDVLEAGRSILNARFKNTKHTDL
jgi:heptosyltransferase-2